jgi:putative toxin-antitoxin system antitoxin component (TIGR02293 family)
MNVAAVLESMGGERAVGAPVASMAELDRLVRHGLPKRVLGALASHFADDEAGQRRFIYEIVPRATWERRETLTPEAGERVERLARLWAAAREVWDEDGLARRFMTSPHQLLDGETPVQAARTELGGRRVERILNGLLYGLPA